MDVFALTEAERENVREIVRTIEGARYLAARSGPSNGGYWAEVARFKLAELAEMIG